MALYFKDISDSLLEFIGPGSSGEVFIWEEMQTAWQKALGLQCAGIGSLQMSSQHVYQSRLCQPACQLQISHFPEPLYKAI